MRRRLLISGLLALVLAAPAQAQLDRKLLLMPGVSYAREVAFTSHGPVVYHVLTAPRPGGLYALRPVLSQGSILGVDTVTAMQRQVSSQATVAGVNGDLFNSADGHPTGVLIRSGALDRAPSPDRSSTGIATDGTLRVSRIAYTGIWRGTGQRRQLVLNQPPGPNGVALFTSSWGPSTPALPGAVQAVLTPFPAALPNTDLSGPVAQIGPGDGGVPIPAGGAVLVARGSGATKLSAEAPVGTTVVVRHTLTPDWSGVAEALGGGPVLVRASRPVFRANELFSTEQLGPRNPRSAVGQLGDGRIVLVAVDGRQPGYSVGMTNFELAVTMARLGAISATALDAGGSTTMAFDGRLLNRPSDPGGERKVAEALLVFYYGVYAPPPITDVVSPNGDGVNETQSFSYKVARPSTVTASLVGPDRVARPLDAGLRAPGSYRFAWPATREDGTPELEGPWRLEVSAVDDRGESSTASRPFSVNNTLASLTVDPTLSVPDGVLRSSFTLAHPARVVARVETRAGVVVKNFFASDLQPGPKHASWRGKDGRGQVTFAGRYVLRVIATNELGEVDLARPFVVRR